METPQAIIWRSTAGASLDGPSVTTILVFDMLASYYDYSDIMSLVRVVVIAIQLSGGSTGMRANDLE
jgi:hypothetical protein